MNPLFQQLANFGVGRLVAILGLTAGAAAALVFFTMSMNSNGEALLYSSLQPNDAAAVSERLDQSGIQYTLREGGTAVYVPTNQIDEARMRVASGGALGFGSVGYEIFDESDALGTTSFVQNVNAKRALEGELSRSINTLFSVSSARVHLVLPERRLFSRDQETPSASVILSVQGDIQRGQVETIKNLVATAVPGLAANRITIADDTGRLLASPRDGEGFNATALDDQRTGFEENLRQKILNVVEGVVGTGGARVVVTAELSLESMTSEALVYDPNTQVEVSRSQITEESSEPTDAGAVSVSENTPDAQSTDPAGQQLSSQSRDETLRNYQNSSTKTTRVLEAGGVERLSVSVVVDQVSAIDEEGNLTFTPRTAEEMAQIQTLVAAAAGFPLTVEQRTENQILEVQQMRFSRPDLTVGTPAPTGFSIAQLDFMRIAEIAVLFITSVLVIFMVARPLIQGAAGGGSGQAAIANSGPSLVMAQPGAAEAAGSIQLPTGDMNGENVVAMLPSVGGDILEDEHIDVAQIDGQVKKSSVRKVAQLVDQHPDESMSILRTWMHEDGASA